VVRLPLAANPRPAGRAEPEPRPSTVLASRRVLVVDDNSDAAESLGVLLRLLGADVRVVYNGRDALVALTEYRPAVVVLDIGMPNMDGHEVARQIRQRPEFQDVTLIALTGWGAGGRSPPLPDSRIQLPLDQARRRRRLANLVDVF
jgi:PleD family two-component response regulator